MTTKDTSTVTTAGAIEVSLTAMTAAMQEIGLLAMPTDWILLSPDGQVWKGDPMKLLQVLMPHHPLLKTPSFRDML